MKFGDGSDLYVSHTGSDSRIINTTGDLKIRSQSLKLETTDAQEYVRCTADQDVKLFHDNVQKFSTLSTGSGTTGESVADSFGQRLKTSNTGSTNDNYWKIGSYDGNGSEGFIATWIGTAGYSSGQQISGAMTLHARVSNGSTLDGIYTGETSGGTLAVKDIRWKHEGSNVFSIWVKVGNYGQISPFVQTFGGTWTSDNTNTASSTAPASSTAFSKYAYKQVGANATIQYSETNTTFSQDINLASGIGINFHPQGGSDVNLLDDYEEGSWTAGVNDYSATYANQQGYYRKVGSLVFATCILAGSGSPGSGNLIVTSLPFSSQNTTAYRSVASFFAWTGFVTGGLQVVGSMSENSNQVTLLGINNNGNATTINRSALNSSGWEFQMSITYCSA